MSQLRTPRTRAELLVRSMGFVFGAIVAILIMLGLLLAAWRMFQREREATQTADAAEARLATLKAENAQVEHDISSLSSDRGVEAALRERFGVARPGEEVIQIVDQGPQASTTTTLPSGNGITGILHALFSW